MLEVLFLSTENDQAAEQCPLFPEETEIRGLPNPVKATGTEEEIMAAFREVRDALREQLAPLLKARLQSEQV
jgi:arsenate reductase